MDNHNVTTDQALHSAITTQFTRFKFEGTARTDRMAACESLIDAYLIRHDKIPPITALDRMATLILQDELTDATPWKSQNNEYHIQSEREELDYYKGLTARQIPETYAADGSDRRTPTRRQRNPSENAHIDRVMGGKRRNDYKSTQTASI